MTIKNQEMTVALCQMNSTDDVDTNLMQMESLIEKIPEASNVRLICFPENCLYMRIREGERIQGMRPSDDAFQSLQSIAKKKKTFIHLGALPLRIDDHLYNSSVTITDQGEFVASYQKMHLFDIQLEGQAPFRESDVYRHGQKPQILEIDGWKFGQTICYDLRFSELFAWYAARDVDAFLVPASFLVKTGEAHWEVLMRARAIESQAYIIASAQGGAHRSVNGVGLRETYGNSLIADPWGKVVLGLDETPSIQIYTLSRALIEKVRTQIPMKFHRRLSSIS